MTDLTATSAGQTHEAAADGRGPDPRKVIDLDGVRQLRGPNNCDVEIVVPVYNEEEQLVASIRRLRRYLDESFPFSANIVITDNASTDRTWSLATSLAHDLPGVRAVHLDRKGRGRALRHAWLSSSAPVVAYMDVDLATGLDALLPLVAPLLSGHSDVAIGSRLARGAHVVRGAKRELISRGYNRLLQMTLRVSFGDAQCGFKALRREVAEWLLPSVVDNGWFFDTELLVLAQRAGLRIHEVPVDWCDDPDSRVDIVRTAIGDLRGVWRMLWTGRPPEHRRVGRTDLPGQLTAEDLLELSGVGLANLACYLAGFVLLRQPLGVLPASAVAMGVCSLVHVAARGRLVATGAGRPDRRSGPAWVAMTAVVGTLNVGLTTAGLQLVLLGGQRSLAAELLAGGAGAALAAVASFALLRTWFFRPRLGSLSPARQPDIGMATTPRPTSFPRSS